MEMAGNSTAKLRLLPLLGLIGAATLPTGDAAQDAIFQTSSVTLECVDASSWKRDQSSDECQNLCFDFEQQSGLGADHLDTFLSSIFPSGCTVPVVVETHFPAAKTCFQARLEAFEIFFDATAPAMPPPAIDPSKDNNSYGYSNSNVNSGSFQRTANSLQDDRLVRSEFMDARILLRNQTDTTTPGDPPDFPATFERTDCDWHYDHYRPLPLPSSPPTEPPTPAEHECSASLALNYGIEFASVLPRLAAPVGVAAEVYDRWLMLDAQALLRRQHPRVGLEPFTLILGLDKKPECLLYQLPPILLRLTVRNHYRGQKE